jgi:hypothetical protein
MIVLLIILAGVIIMAGVTLGLVESYSPLSCIRGLVFLIGITLALVGAWHGTGLETIVMIGLVCWLVRRYVDRIDAKRQDGR